jgi:(1->4)-alpha-D-glucan 1-alpha-D-glucosylmutase
LQKANGKAADGKAADGKTQLAPRQPPAKEAFLSDLLTLQRNVAYFGYFNALSQIVLKMTCPGVPDLYQGNELWDFSLVDPDNRRPVDYRRRRQLLADLQARLKAKDQLAPLVWELLSTLSDGRIKLYVTFCTLNFRRQHEAFFRDSSYQGLEVTGDRRDRVCAFARRLERQAVLVAVPRLIRGLCAGKERPPVGPEVWGKTWLALGADLAGRAFRNLYTGEVLQAGEHEGQPGLPLAEVFREFPVAVLDGATRGKSDSAESS